MGELTAESLMEDLIKDKRFRYFIISANTNEQLYDEGIDSSGKTLGVYTPYTRDIKISQGVEYRHVTLRDTGEFYRSFRVALNNDSDVMITANSIKEGVDLIEKYGKNILGLTDENLSRLRDLCIIILRQSILKRLRNIKLKAA